MTFTADVAVDWLNDQLYWVDRDTKLIEAYDLATEERKVVTSTGGRDSTPLGLTLFAYPEYGYVQEHGIQIKMHN